MNPDNHYNHYQQQVLAYLREGHAEAGGFPAGDSYQVRPLAAGEYNQNYVFQREGGDSTRFVFRVNIGTQINRADQIEYEYKALRLLADSGVTPKPFWVDDSRQHIDRGVSIMEFLPGRHLDYTRDLAGAARSFAAIHQLQIDPAANHLIVEELPLSLIFNECSALLDRYLLSELADPELRSYLGELRDWADQARHRERFFTSDPFHCIVNTEVNSGNFIVNDEENTVHLVDWEMPRWGDPSSDLCHFCSPLTTLWKTEHRLSDVQYRQFVTTYTDQLGKTNRPDLRRLSATLEERMQLKMPFVYLRGISWSAMGWEAYQTDFAGIRNEDTWKKLCRYLRPEFVRSLFDPFLQGKA